MKPKDIQLAQLQTMSAGELRDTYLRLFGEPVRSGNRAFIVRRLAWRIQSQAEGGLTKRAIDRADQLANLDDIRLKAPSEFELVPTTSVSVTLPKSEPSLLPGTYITRNYKGRLHAVKVLDDGFEYENKEYRSLTAVTLAITGSKWNGRHFFGLTKDAEVVNG